MPASMENKIATMPAQAAESATVIQALIERLAAAKGPSQLLDAQIAVAVGGYAEIDRSSGQEHLRQYVSKGERCSIIAPPKYTGSIDAALTLVPAGMFWTVKHRAHPYQGRWPFEAHVHNGKIHGDGYDGEEGFSFSAPLALCIASLKARAALTGKAE